MARNDPKDRVKVEVEAQAASCRTLADAMRNHANSLGWLRHGEAKIIEGWAGILDDISIAMVEAINPEHPDPGLLQRMWSGCRQFIAPIAFVGGGLAGGVFEAAGQDLYDYFKEDAHLASLAHEVVERADTHMTIVLGWDPNAPTSEPQAVTGTAAITDDDDTAHGVGTVGPDPATATDEAHAAYDGGLQGNRTGYGERDENGRPVQSGNVELPEPSTVENLGYVGSDLPSIGPGQPEKSLTILQLRKTIGRRLAELRRLLGQTLPQVADEHAVPVSTIANIESGHTNQDDLTDYVNAILRTDRYRTAEPEAVSLMDEVRSLLAQANPG